MYPKYFYILKKIFFFAMLMMSVCLSAQMDYEHWFAPMGNNYRSTYNFQSIYLSTSETTPFEVSVYNAGRLIGKVTISKGSPGKFDIPREYIITEEDRDRMSVISKGLHLIGDKKYFANLRFSVLNHAEIVTSKGLAGLGNKFYIGMPEVSLWSPSGTSNHTVSVIATENGTTVTLSGYDPALVFTNDPAGLPTKTVVLNKDESYIFEINNSNVQNFKKGLIGAKIESDKPISVSNGSFSGRTADTGVDIFMDQAVPVEKTGQESIIMNGNGNLNSPSPSVMEKTLIIATEDNTDVFVNNNMTSTADYQLTKAGDFVFIDSVDYFPLSASDNVYGLHVKTSKNAYIYALLAGSSANEKASGGMNLIPALSCFLPSKIDELSAVDENEVQTSYDGLIISNNVKLNIIAQAGADVYVNNSKTGVLGPYAVLGNSDWELYSVLNVKGNITVESKNNKAITAGIAGGSSNIGFGGYFAGFSSIPSISKVGDCAKGQELVVDDIYDKYEWFYSLDNITYVSYPGNTYYITPGTKFGYYKCEVTKLSCLPAKTTKEFKYLKCTAIGTPKNYTIGACNSIPVITPVFTDSTAAAIDITKTYISQQPDGGNAYVDSGGKIHFDAANTTADHVTFKYYFESIGTFPDSEEITVTVNIVQIKLNNTEITECVDYDGKGYYDLKLAFEPINQDATFTKYTYYKDAALSQVIPTGEISAYHSEPDKIVYVVVTNSYGCDNRSTPAQIVLKTFELPEIKTIDVIDGTSVSINAIGGKKPYRYYIRKGIAIQPLPLLQDYSLSDTLPVTDGKGLYTAFVKSADNSYDCNPVTQVFAVIGISNIITPNDDGKNDTIDMSILSYKMNPKFQVFDREGTKVFEGSSANKFIWTGKDNGSALPTSTYWYLLQWQDFEGADLDVMNGWILLKNRNSD